MDEKKILLPGEDILKPTSGFDFQLIPSAPIDSVDPQILNNLQYMLKDLLQGDMGIGDRAEFQGMDLNQIKLALDFILNDNDLSLADKSDLLANSWRINYRDKPPTPEEFLTFKYIGPVADTIFPHVKKAFIEFMDPTKPYRTLVLAPFIGYGKMIHPDSLVHTPSGPRRIKDLQIGDNVITPDQKVARVKQTAVFKNEEFAKITFSDGRTIISGLDHYYKAARSKTGGVNNRGDKEAQQRPCWKIISLREIIKRPGRWFIPMTQPVEYIPQEHSIDPYVLGAYLGDGYYRSGVIVGDDESVHTKICKIHPSSSTKKYSKAERSVSFITRLGKKEKQALIQLDQYCLAHEKYIPDEYLYDSVENRIKLLQGLMDTDGTVAKHEKAMQPTFYTTSERLRDTFITLIRGLGGKANFSTDNRYKKEGSVARRPGYAVFFTFPTNNFPVFSLERKQQLIDEDFNREDRVKSKPKYLYIKDIEPLPSQDGVCIELDDENHLFLADDYVVTHNSFLSVMVNLYIGTNLSMMKHVWKFMGQSPATLYCQVLGAQSLKKSSELLLEPFMNILESSDFFEKVQTKDGMAKRDKDFSRMGNIDKLFWTTAVPTSALQFSGGANFKLVSNPNALLGQAQPLDCTIKLPDGSYTKMGDLKVGDEIASPSEQKTTVTHVFPQGLQKTYRIILADGRSTRCNPSHLWKVQYVKPEVGLVTDIVPLQYMIDNPQYDFEIYDIDDCVVPEVPNYSWKGYGNYFDLDHGVWVEGKEAR